MVSKQLSEFEKGQNIAYNNCENKISMSTVCFLFYQIRNLFVHLSPSFYNSVTDRGIATKIPVITNETPEYF